MDDFDTFQSALIEETPWVVRELLLRDDPANGCPPREPELPCRLIAARGDWKALVVLHNLLQKQPTEHLDLIQPLVELAKHRDPWLSGPAVMMLGLLAPQSWEASEPIFAGSEEQREAKAFLMLCSASTRGQSSQGSAAAKALPAAHPASRVVEWLSIPLPKSADEWRERLDAHSDTRDWLWLLQGGHGWDGFLWEACCYFLGKEFKDSL